FLFVSMLVASCGGGSNLVSLETSGNDAMQYDKKELRSTEGSFISLTLQHISSMSKYVMGHHHINLKEGVDMQAFATADMSEKDNDYFPASMSSDVIAHTKMIGGGESTTITFQAPPKGTYTFFCSFPGHYAMMQGQLIVE